MAMPVPTAHSMMPKRRLEDEDPTGQKYGRLEEEQGMGPDKVSTFCYQSYGVF